MMPTKSAASSGTLPSRSGSMSSAAPLIAPSGLRGRGDRGGASPQAQQAAGGEGSGRGGEGRWRGGGQRAPPRRAPRGGGGEGGGGGGSRVQGGCGAEGPEIEKQQLYLSALN